MALDKLVDSTQLDSDLTSVANAIRTKGGTSAQLAFPADFVTAIGAISGGGGITLEEFLRHTKPTGAIEVSGYNIVDGALRQCPITSFKMVDRTHTIGGDIVRACTSLTTFFADVKSAGNNGCYGCTNLETAVVDTANNTTMQGWFYGCSKLAAADFGSGITGISTNQFTNCTLLKTIILRKSNALVTNGNATLFNGTPFASGGSGGTIYIPKALYDHLGDGGSFDYKAKTNWSTINGYGTITWAKIEGSYYETHYADGTAIS